MERTLEKKEATLDTLLQLLDQIQGAETNNMVSFVICHALFCFVQYCPLVAEISKCNIYF